MKILAISGSLRLESTNTGLLRAVEILAPSGAGFTLYGEMERIPPFNPDLDVAPVPEPVVRLRAALVEASIVVFSTPEYAHGLPGSLKNLLDWVVGSGELSEKPVALINASSRGEYAQASLREVLKTMNARVLSDAETTLPLLGKRMSPAEIAADAGYAALIRGFLLKIQDGL